MIIETQHDLGTSQLIIQTDAHGTVLIIEQEGRRVYLAPFKVKLIAAAVKKHEKQLGSKVA